MDGCAQIQHSEMNAYEESEGLRIDSAAPCRLTGLQYSPLPDESTFSALMRLAWLNVFDRRELADYCIGPGRAVPHFAEFRSLKWVQSDLIFRSLGWTLPNSIEPRIHAKFSNEAELSWNFHNLKFCPLCMEGLYHAIWFQLRNLQRCPLHDCRLVETCMSCGARSPAYEFESQIFDNAYRCATCGKPFSGAPPDVEAHEVLRGGMAQVEKSFAEYHAWLERVDLKAYHRHWPEKPASGWDRWCCVKSIQEHYLHRISVMPSEIAPPARNDLIALCWKTRMFVDDRFDCRNSSVYENGDEMELVLNVFLRCLLPWAFSGVSDTEQEAIRARFDGNEPIYPQDFDAKQLAYLIVEGSHRWFFGPRKGQLGRMKSWCNRVPKVAYCAYLYGVYAGIYHSLKKMQRRGQIAWAPYGFYRVSDYLIAMCSVSREEHSGRIIFPEVPGMPLLLKFGQEGKANL